MAPVTMQWYYQVAEDKYLPLPDEASEELEQQYSTWYWTNREHRPTVTHIQSGKYMYDVNFGQMTQTNTHTGRTRTLQRRENRAMAQLGREVEELRDRLSSSQRLIDESAQLRAQMAEWKGKYSQKVEALRTSQRDLERISKKIADQEQQLERTSTKVADQEQQLERTSKRVAEQEQQISNLQVANRRMRQESDQSAQRREALERQVQDLQQENADQQQRLADYARNDTVVHRWEFENHLRRWQPYDAESNQRLEELYCDWQNDGGYDQDFLLSDLYTVNFHQNFQTSVRYGTRRQIRRASTVCNAADGHIETLQQELEELREWKMQHEGERQRHEAERRRLREQLTDIQNRNQQREAELTQNACELDPLREQLQCLQEKSEQHTIENLQLRTELEAFQQVQHTHRSFEADILEAQDRQRSLEAQVHELEQQRERLKEYNRSFEADILEAQERQRSLEAQVHELEQQRERLAEENHKVHDEKTELKASLNKIDERLAGVVQKSRDEEAKTDRLKEEVDDLQQQLDKTLEQKNDISEKHAALEAKLKTLDPQIAKLETLKKKIKDLEIVEENVLKEVAKGNQREEKLKKEIDRLNAEHKNSIATAVEAARKSADSNLKKQLNDAQDKFKELQKEKEKLIQQLDQGKKDLDGVSKLIMLHLTANQRTRRQQEVVQSMSRARDEDLLHRVAPDPDTTAMMRESHEFRRKMLSLGPRFLAWFGSPSQLMEGEAEVQLSPDTAEFMFIAKAFHNSITKHRLHYESEEWCEQAQLEIHSITMLAASSDRLRAYKGECTRVHKKSLHEVPVPFDGVKPVVADDLNETFVFHGSPWETIPKICASGFDCAYAGTNKGAMFGRGMYFAPNASKCDLYTDPDDEGRRCMILARVLLGSCLPKWRKCVQIETLGKFDSVCAVPRDLGGAVDHVEFCIYQNSQAIPAFQIVYSHKVGCQCNICSRTNV